MDIYTLYNDTQNNRYYELHKYQPNITEIKYTDHSINLVVSTIMWFIIISYMVLLCTKCMDTYDGPSSEVFQEIVDQYKLKLEESETMINELKFQLNELQSEVNNSNKLLLETKDRYFSCRDAARKFIDVYSSDLDLDLDLDSDSDSDSDLDLDSDSDSDSSV